jgi:phage shock protein A
MERPTKMSQYDPTVQDLQRTVDELRNTVLEAKMAVSLLESYLAKANQQTADWQDLATRAIAQIEEWRALCDTWQTRYNQLLGGN